MTKAQTETILTVAASCLALVSSFGTPLPAMAAKSPVANTRSLSAQQIPARLLTFSGDKSYGVLYFIPTSTKVLDCKTNERGVRAQGTVKAPPNCYVWLDATANFLQHPEGMKALPDNAFDILQIHFVAMEPEEEKLLDNGLVYASRFKSIKRLVLSRSDACDAQLLKFSRLRDLEAIEVLGTKCDGSFLRELSGSKAIKMLILMHLVLNKANLKYLGTMPNLERITLANTKITCDDLKALLPLKAITELDLAYNKTIDDRIFDYLKTFKNLNELDLRYTAITYKGLEKLKGLKLRALWVTSQSVVGHENDLKILFPHTSIKIDIPKQNRVKEEYRDIEPLP